ncbi:hypothetical protein [Ferrimicrobium acidiphilum]|uniref:hypothetical protein n=1 Tax=Ferrimicrobium acidiphilum TaxID=121039 RepID=UPI0023F0A961|nr:hypothetical protein [Ferrimicrobium acidiphilum]
MAITQRFRGILNKLKQDDGFSPIALPIVMMILLIFFGSAASIAEVQRAQAQAYLVADDASHAGANIVTPASLDQGVFSTSSGSVTAADGVISGYPGAGGSCTQVNLGGAYGVNNTVQCVVTYNVPVPLLSIFGIHTITVSAKSTARITTGTAS